MNPSKKNIKQHIVPQSYLRRFARRNINNKGYHIGVRRCSSGNASLFTQAIDNIAYVENYYDVPIRDDPKYWEKYFSKHLETLYGTPLENIITKITLNNSNVGILSNDDKEILSRIICFQYQRIPEFLDYHLERNVKIGNELREWFLHYYGDSISSDQARRIRRMQIDNTIMKDFAFEAITDSEKLEKYSSIMKQRIWTANYNNTRIPFITSDNPVLMYNLLTGSTGYSDNGILRFDTIIYFPISSKIMIQIIPSGLFGENGKTIDGLRVVLSDRDLKFVISINTIQMDHALSESYMDPVFLDEVKKYQYNSCWGLSNDGF